MLVNAVFVIVMCLTFILFVIVVDNIDVVMFIHVIDVIIAGFWSIIMIVMVMLSDFAMNMLFIGDVIVRFDV